MCTSVNGVDSPNELSSFRCLAIRLTNDGLLSIESATTNFGEISIKYKYLRTRKFMKNVVCKMSAILFRPHRVQSHAITGFHCALLCRITYTGDKTHIVKMQQRIKTVCLITTTLCASILANNTSEIEFLPTLKPLYCHEIQDIEARSQVECAVYCKKDLYSCVGYAFTHDKSYDNCQTCYINDIKSRISLSPKTSESTLFLMPMIELQRGKRLWNFIQKNFL